VVDHPASFVRVAGRRFGRADEMHLFQWADQASSNLRSIYCVDDGARGDFAAYGGEALPVEAGFDY